MKRLEFPFKAKTEYAHHLIDDDSFKGDVSLIRFYDVQEEMIKEAFNKNYKLISNDHYWLQIAPLDKHYWLTVMIDPSFKITQYYFDITKENIINEENSSFIDFYLDLLVLPNGQYQILDEDELQEAFNQKLINQTEVYEAYSDLCDLINHLDVEKLASFSLKQFQILHPLLKEEGK